MTFNNTKSMIKVSGKIPMGGNSEMWSNEALAALYKQHPYLGANEVNLQIDAHEPNLGAMIGSFIVTPPGSIRTTDNQAAGSGYNTQIDPAAKSLRIPVVINAGKLSGFDVFVSSDGKFRPLNEERFNAASAEDPTYYAASPADLAGGGGGGGMTPDVPTEGPMYGRRSAQGAGATKLASLMRGVGAEDVNRFADSLPTDAETQAAVGRVPQLVATMIKMAGLVTVPRLKVVAPTGFVMTKCAGGFEALSFCKTSGFTSATLPNSAGLSIPDLALQELMTPGGVVVVNDGGPGLEISQAVAAEEIVDFGAYAVMTKSASLVDAVVFTDVRRVSGEKTGLKIAVSMSGATLQQDVVGVKLAHLVAPPISSISESSANGPGFFIVNDYVTTPVVVRSRISSPLGDSYMYQDDMGVPGLLKKANVNTVTHIRGNDYLVPMNTRFVSTTTGVKLVDSISSYTKLASVANSDRTMSVYFTDRSYALRGSGSADISDDDKNGLTKKAAAAVLVSLGGTAESINSVLDTARALGSCEFVHPEVVAVTARTKTASADLSYLRVNLLPDMIEILNMPGTHGSPILEKLAQSIAAQDSIDSILALNFVNSDNVAGFVDLIPEYEQVVQRLAELLMAARIGLPDVPESAVESAMKNLDRVLTGLSALADKAGSLGGE